jgi:hypothetical protein
VPARRRRLALLLGATAWAALALQFLITTSQTVANGSGLAYGIGLYFSFFTILTNTLAALTLTLPAVAPRSMAGRFFASPVTTTGVSAAIAMVGLVYVTLLRHVWEPQGAQLVADVALHYASPVLFVAYWWFAVDKRELSWRDVPWYLAYPLVYLGYALVRGALVGHYPYHFIDAGLLSYSQVAVNSVGLTLVFVIVASLFTWLGRLQARAVHR